jgi:hypothetical protein
MVKVRPGSHCGQTVWTVVSAAPGVWRLLPTPQWAANPEWPESEATFQMLVATRHYQKLYLVLYGTLFVFKDPKLALHVRCPLLAPQTRKPPY